MSILCRFTDVDRRFSKVSRAVGNMHARHLHHNNSASGRLSPQVTSSNLTSGVCNRGGREGVTEASVPEADYCSSTHRQRSLSKKRGVHYLPSGPSASPTQLVGWYQTTNGQSMDRKPSSSCVYNRHPVRSEKCIGRKQTDQNSVPPFGEYEYKTTTTCKHCGKIVLTTDDEKEDGGCNDDEDKQPPFRTVITAIMLRLLT